MLDWDTELLVHWLAIRTRTRLLTIGFIYELCGQYKEKNKELKSANAKHGKSDRRKFHQPRTNHIMHYFGHIQIFLTVRFTFWFQLYLSPSMSTWAGFSCVYLNLGPPIQPLGPWVPLSNPPITHPDCVFEGRGHRPAPSPPVRHRAIAPVEKKISKELK